MQRENLKGYTTLKLLSDWKRVGVWKEYQFAKMGKWLTTIWSAITSIIMKGCFSFWRIFSRCWLSLLSLQSNHFISEGGKKKKSILWQIISCVSSEWVNEPPLAVIDCLILQLCAGGMRRRRRRDKFQSGGTGGGVYTTWSREPRMVL